MLEGLLGSVVGKIIATVTGVAGVFGGLAVAGALPGIGGATDQPASVSSEVSTPAGDASVAADASAAGIDVPGIPSIPEMDLPVPVGAPDVLAAAGQAQQTASEARAAASECVNGAIGQITALVGSLAGATNPEQIQALVDQAAAIGQDARECAEAARALAMQSVNEANVAAGLLANLPVAGANPASDEAEQGFAAADQAVTDANGVADAALQLALGIVDNVLKIATSALGDLPTVPGVGDGSLPSVPGLGGGGLPGLGEGGLPGLGEGGLPTVPGIGSVDPAEIGLGLANEVLTTISGAILDGGLPVPGGLPGLG